MKTILWYINSSKIFSQLSEKDKADLSSMLRVTNVKKGSGRTLQRLLKTPISVTSKKK
jgi:hypothetical protein